MTIYEHKTSLLIQGGSSATTTLNVRGGLLQQVFIHAQTNTTVFRAHLTDEDGLFRMSWDFTTGTLNDVGMMFPIVNRYVLNITNANQTDTIDIRLGVQEQ